ncbi:hypothetical protein ACIBRY_22540 [Streptomyces anulatus]
MRTDLEKETNIMTVEIVGSISDRLVESEAHRAFVDHEFFKQVNSSELSHEHVGMFLGQWWHPLHYFPTFLARCISVLPDIESKSAITRILSQEVGVRSVKAAHEVIYAAGCVTVSPRAGSAAICCCTRLGRRHWPTSGARTSAAASRPTKSPPHICG